MENEILNNEFTVEFWFRPAQSLQHINIPMIIGYTNWRNNLDWWTDLNKHSSKLISHVSQLMQEKYPGDYELRWDPELTTLYPHFDDPNKELLWKIKFQ